MRNEYENPLYGVAYHDVGFPHDHGSGTSTKTPTPSPTPKPRYSDLSENQLQQYVVAGIISMAELVTLKGADKASAIMAQKLTSSDLAAIEALKKSPPTTGTPSQVVAPGKGVPATTGTDWAAVERAYDTGSPEANYGAVSNAGTPSAQNATVSTAASAPAAPKPPARNSIADLVARGALNVSGTPVLEGQQYRRINEVVQAPDGQWYVVNPQGQPMSGPFPNQTQANAANVYTELGPAVTSNQYANIGNMALAGANRPRISTGTGQDAVTSLDQIIQATKAKGMQLSDFLGAANIPGAGLADVGYGKIPDYGGMRGVLDAAGNVQSFTGRMLAPDGREIAVGQSAPIDQGSTEYGTQIQSVLAPYLSQSQINKIDPADYAQISLAVNALRDQGQLNQADTAATKQYQAANYKALTGQDPYALDILPETYAHGGSMTIREPSVIQGLLSGKPYGVMGAGQGERVSNITPLGNAGQQVQAQQQEQGWARFLGGGNQSDGFEGQLPGPAPQVPVKGLISNYGDPRLEAGTVAPYTYYSTGNRMADLRALMSHPGEVEIVRRDPRAWEMMNPGAENNGGGTGGGNGGGRDFIDRNENGIDDREEEWTRPDGSKYKRRRKWTPTPQTPPTPNVFGMGGQVTSSPAMNPMHDPMVLEMMARGVRKRAKKLLPAGYI